MKTTAAALFCALGVGLCFDRAFSADSSHVARQVTKEVAGFPHSKPKHRTLECSKCHTISPQQIDVREMPGHNACISCHNLALESLSKPITFCGICHEGRAISKTQAALFRFPKAAAPGDFGQNFSHPAHLKPAAAAELKTPRCTDCHKMIQPAKAAAPEMSIETGHSVCFKCHGEKPAKPPSMFQCAECHKVDGPHAPHLYGLVKEFKHADHDYDIRPKKKADLRIPRPPDYLCSECHSSVVTAPKLSDIALPEEKHCNACHNGRIGLPDPLVKSILDGLRRRR